LAAKFLKVNLPKDGDKVWWQQFEVTPRQLEGGISSSLRPIRFLCAWYNQSVLILKLVCSAEVSNQMLELYEQNKSNGATGSLANDPSPSDMNRGQAPFETPSLNGHHHQQSPMAKPEVVEAKVDEASGQRDEEYAGGRVHSSSPLYTPNMVRTYSDPPSDRPSEARHNGISETSGVQALNGRIKQETAVKKEVLRSNGEKVEHYHEYREETKTSVARVDRNDDGGLNARERRRETEDWIGKEKTKEKTATVVKSETVEIKPKGTETKVITEEKDTKKEFVSLDEVNKDKIKAALEKRRKSRVEVKPPGVKHEPTNEEELLERELESFVDAEAEKSVKERRDKKPSRSELDFAGGKEHQPGAKKPRVKEEGDLKSKIEHDATGLKERVAEGDLAPPTKKKIVKEHERKQVLLYFLPECI
jgi:cyclin T